MTQYTDAVDENFCVLTSGDWIIIHVAVTSVVCRRCVVFPLLSTRGFTVAQWSKDEKCGVMSALGD